MCFPSLNSEEIPSYSMEILIAWDVTEEVGWFIWIYLIWAFPSEENFCKREITNAQFLVSRVLFEREPMQPQESFL